MASLEQKLEELDKEIYTLHQFCVNKGYNPHQIEKSAQPLFTLLAEHKRKKFLSLGLKLAVVAAVFAVLVYYDPLYNFITAGARLAFIQILPYWDWTQLRDEPCLLANPYYTGPKLKEEDCELCESLTSVQRLQNVSQNLVAENYIKLDQPFIVTDALSDWDALQKFNVHFLDKLYHTEENLKKIPTCMFATNLRASTTSPKSVLRRAANADIENYFAHWENCDKIAAKSLRQFYKRPYFLPPMVEMAEPNWIFVAHSYKGKKSKPADIALPMMWIGVLKGQMKIILQARKPCKGVCPMLYATVHTGEILVVTDLMWLLDYIPDSEGEMVALGGGGYFD